MGVRDEPGLHAHIRIDDLVIDGLDPEQGLDLADSIRVALERSDVVPAAGWMDPGAYISRESDMGSLDLSDAPSPRIAGERVGSALIRLIRDGHLE